MDTKTQEEQAIVYCSEYPAICQPNSVTEHQSNPPTANNNVEDQKSKNTKKNRRNCIIFTTCIVFSLTLNVMGFVQDVHKLIKTCEQTCTFVGPTNCSEACQSSYTCKPLNTESTKVDILYMVIMVVFMQVILLYTVYYYTLYYIVC